jgi:hypothetical protein
MKPAGECSLSRRSLLLGVTLLPVGAGLVAACSKPARQADLVMAVIMHRADYVVVEESDLRRFAEDYVRQPHWHVRTLLLSTSLQLFYPAMFPFSAFLLQDMRAEIEMMEKIVVTDFLLACDYFSGEIMPGKIVRYRGTLRYACSNPFARFT